MAMLALAYKQPARLFLISLVISGATHAEVGRISPLQDPEDQRAMRKITGIFDTDLPKTEQKGSVRFIMHPHMGDFRRRSYIRLPLGFRWGVNDHVEMTATVEPYIEHGLRRGSPRQWYRQGSIWGKIRLPSLAANRLRRERRSKYSPALRRAPARYDRWLQSLHPLLGRIAP